MAHFLSLTQGAVILRSGHEPSPSPKPRYVDVDVDVEPSELT
jgi:hypothetical protein